MILVLGQRSIYPLRNTGISFHADFYWTTLITIHTLLSTLKSFSFSRETPATPTDRAQPIGKAFGFEVFTALFFTLCYTLRRDCLPKLRHNITMGFSSSHGGTWKRKSESKGRRMNRRWRVCQREANCSRAGFTGGSVAAVPNLPKLTM